MATAMVTATIKATAMAPAPSPATATTTTKAVTMAATPAAAMTIFYCCIDIKNDVESLLRQLAIINYIFQLIKVLAIKMYCIAF